MKVRKKAVLCAILAGIMLSTATPSLKLTVFADSAITETEALDKADRKSTRLNSSHN